MSGVRSVPASGFSCEYATRVMFLFFLKNLPWATHTFIQFGGQLLGLQDCRPDLFGLLPTGLASGFLKDLLSLLLVQPRMVEIDRCELVRRELELWILSGCRVRVAIETPEPMFGMFLMFSERREDIFPCGVSSLGVP